MVELPAPSKTNFVRFGPPAKLSGGTQPLKAVCPLCNHATEVLPCAEYAPITCPGCGLRYKPTAQQTAAHPKANACAVSTDAPTDPLLQRWLAGEPIAPPQLTQWQRLVRWSRQHPAKCFLLATTVCLLIAGSLASVAGLSVTRIRLNHTARIWQQAEQERLQAEALAAEHARLAAEKQRQAEAEAAARRAAEQRAQQAEADRRRAELERLEADKQRQQAARQARLALAEQQSRDAALLLRSQPLQSCLLATASLQTKLAEGVPADSLTQQILCDALAELGVPALPGNHGTITTCQTDRTGRLLVTGGDDGALRLWNLQSATWLHVNNSPLGNISGLSGSAMEQTSVEEKRAPAQQQALPRVLQVHGKPISALAISPDGNRLVSADRSGLVVWWNLASPDPASQAIILHQFASPVNAVVFSQDGRWLAAVAGTPNSIEDTARLWELSADGQPGTGLPLRGHFGQVRAAAFSPEGNWLATAGADRTVRLWNLRCQFPSAEQIVLHGHENQAAAVAIACDGRWLASASYDGTVRLWNLRQADPGANPLTLSGHNGWVDVIEVSPDGRYLASGGYDGTVRVWDLHAADPNKSCSVLSGHTARIRRILFLSDGRRLATASDDRTVRVWDLSAASPSVHPLVLRGHWGPVVSICAANHGRSLLTCSADTVAAGNTAVRIWPLDTADLLAQAMRVCQRSVPSDGNQPPFGAKDMPLMSSTQQPVEYSATRPANQFSGNHGSRVEGSEQASGGQTSEQAFSSQALGRQGFGGQGARGQDLAVPSDQHAVESRQPIGCPTSGPFFGPSQLGAQPASAHAPAADSLR